MADLSEEDKKELAKIRETEDFWKDKEFFQELEMVPFNDEDALKFHKYMKDLAQSLLGNDIDLDKEGIVFLLSDDKQANAAFVYHAKENKKFIFISAALLDMCDNKDQLAFVLGHELQHFLEKVEHGKHAITKFEEGYADLNAIPKMVNAGLNIEEAKVMAEKMFTHKSVMARHLINEHVSDVNRKKLLDMRITAERDHVKKLDGENEDVIGEKTHPLEDDFLSLVHNRPKAQNLRRFFESEQYLNASYEERVDMWFEQFNAKLQLTEDEKFGTRYAELQAIDKKILKEERVKLLSDVNALGRENYNYYFEKKFFDNMLNEKTWVLAASKDMAMDYNAGREDYFLRCPPHLFKDYFKEKFGQLSSVTDKEQAHLMFINMELCSRVMPNELWKTLIKQELLGLTYSEEDVGKSLPKEVLNAVKTKGPLESYFLDDHYEVHRMENGDIALRDGYKWLLFDKEGKIQLVTKNEEKLQAKMLANQINETVQVLNDIRAGKDVDLKLKLETLKNAWLMSSPDIVERQISRPGERFISISKDDFSNGLSVFNSVVQMNLAEVEKYLTPEAKDFWTEKYEPKKPQIYSDFIVDTLVKGIKEEYSKQTLDKEIERLLEDMKLSSIECRLPQTEKIAKAFLSRTDAIFSEPIVKKIAAVKLCEHLASGKELDDFEFPFDKEYKDYYNRVKESGDYKRLFDWKMSTFYTYEMLKKNPEIDLSQMFVEKLERGQEEYYALQKIVLDPITYFSIKLGEEKLKQLEQRLQDNINNPKNWGDGSVAEGMSDMPFRDKFKRITSDAQHGFSSAQKPENLLDIALYFYQKASIEDKIDGYAAGIFNSINRKAEEKVNKAVKEKIWNVIKTDFENKDISFENRFKLFLKAAQFNLFDEEKVHYFETLVGKDGQGGLLKELENVPDPKFHFYLELLKKENRIPDPEIRSKVITLAVKQFHKEEGYYNDLTGKSNNGSDRDSFKLSVKVFLKSSQLDDVPANDEHQFLKELAEITLAQEELCDVIKPNPPKINTQDTKLIAGAYGLDGFSYLMQEGAVRRDVVMDYLLSEGSEKDTGNTLEQIKGDLTNYGYRGSFSKDTAKEYLNMMTPQYLTQVKKEFDAAPLEGKAAIINLLSDGNDWERQFTQVADKLFENAGELGYVGQKFLKSYISSRPASERCFYLSAMFAAANNKSTTYFDDGNSPYTPEQRSLAQGLRLFLENSGPAGVKLAQAMSSYNGVPDFIRDEMQKAKNNANPPARWEVFDWLESAGEKNMLDYGKLGKLLGSASFFVTYEMKGNDGKDKVVKIMRRGSESMANAEFKVYKEMLGKLKEDFPWVESFSRLVQNAADMVKVETNLDIGEQQLKDAQKLYPNKAKADNIEFNLTVMDWGKRGSTWASMEKAHGKDFKDLEQPYKKAVAKAVFTTELANMLSGKRFDSDRHAGQYKIDPETNTIGIFDTGSMSVIEPTTKEKRVLGAVIAETVKTLAENPNENVGAVLCSEIDKGITTYYKQEIAEGKPIPPYLSEFQRGLLALTDFHQEIPAQELAVCLMQSFNNDKHRLDVEIYKGFMAGIKDFAADKVKEVQNAGEQMTPDKALGVINDNLFNDKGALLSDEAAFSQNLGKLVVRQVSSFDNIYEAMVNLPENLKNPKVMEVLNSDVGRIHFAKGMMKGVFDAIDPKHYSAEDRKQMGEILYNVIENSAKQKKLKKQISVTDIFDKALDNTPQLGDYAKKVKAMMQIVAGSEVNIDLKQFKKAVILSRMADKDVQQGYMNALRKSPDTSLFKKALSRVNPISFIPRGSTRKVAKYIVKTVAPKCLKAINKFRENTNTQVKTQQRD